MIRRRHFLAGLSGLSVPAIFFGSLAHAETGSGNAILVAIQMVGGNDGLNTVIPLTQYGVYNTLRTPSVPPEGLALAFTQAQLAPCAFDANPAVAASQATQFAFAPAMGTMRSLYATGHLAVIAGVGLPPAELSALSHYNAQLDWMTGQININGQAPAGWLGLALGNAACGAVGPIASMNGSSPLIAVGASPGLVLSSPIDNFGVSYALSDNYTGLQEAFAATLNAPTPLAAALVEQSAIKSGVTTAQTIGAIARAVPAADYPTPVTALDFQLRDIARLIIGGAGIRGYAAVQDGYDTHASQALYQPALLAQLGTAMANFYAYLQAHGASANVLIMTMSDFGRRPAANLDFGTDHGGGGVSFVLGDPVNGGVYGQYPSLTALDPNANLVATVDFRNLLSNIVSYMGVAPDFISGGPWPRLGFV